MGPKIRWPSGQIFEFTIITWDRAREAGPTSLNKVQSVGTWLARGSPCNPKTNKNCSKKRAQKCDLFEWH